MQVAFGYINVGVVFFVEFDGFPFEYDSAQCFGHDQSDGKDGADDNEEDPIDPPPLTCSVRNPSAE